MAQVWLMVESDYDGAIGTSHAGCLNLAERTQPMWACCSPSEVGLIRIAVARERRRLR